MDQHDKLKHANYLNNRISEVGDFLTYVYKFYRDSMGIRDSGVILKKKVTTKTEYSILGFRTYFGGCLESEVEVPNETANVIIELIEKRHRELKAELEDLLK